MIDTQERLRQALRALRLEVPAPIMDEVDSVIQSAIEEQASALFDERRVQIGCYDCGLAYGSEGWIEAIIPNEVWRAISPTGDEGGILCITCIARRLRRRGYDHKVRVNLCGTELLRQPNDEEYNAVCSELCGIKNSQEERVSLCASCGKRKAKCEGC